MSQYIKLEDFLSPTGDLLKLQKQMDDKTVVFIGAGLSRPYGCCDWGALADNAIKKCHKVGIIDFLTQNDLLSEPNPKIKLTMAKSLIEDSSLPGVQSLFSDVVYDALNINQTTDGSFETKREILPEKIETGMYQYLKQIFSYYITTNADTHIDCLSSNKVVYKSFNDALNKNTLYKIHGCVSCFDSTVFTIDQYLEQYKLVESSSNSTHLGFFLKYIFSKYNVIFMGYSLSELELLERMVGTEKQHYFIKGYYQHQDKVICAFDKYFSKFNIKQVVYDLDNCGHDILWKKFKEYVETRQVELNKPLEQYASIDNALSVVNICPTTIQIVIGYIKNDAEYNRYFFNNLNKMSSPLKWFDPLLRSELLSTENPFAITYIRLIIKHKELHERDDFLNLINLWITYCLNNDGQINNMMWFLEEVINITDDGIQDTCKNIILKLLKDPKQYFKTIMSLGYTYKFDSWVLVNDDFVYEILELITDEQYFSYLKDNVHELLVIKDKLLPILYKKNSDKLSTLITERLKKYLENDPVEFGMRDYIDEGDDHSIYGDYIIGYLIFIIQKNIPSNNNALSNNFSKYIYDNELGYNSRIFIIKILIYIINNIKDFSYIKLIQNHVTNLDELVRIRYALHQCIQNSSNKLECVIKCFNNWLRDLRFSEEFLKRYDAMKIERFEAEVKLPFLKITDVDSEYYQKLKSRYPYEITDPEPTLNIKSSTSSENKLLTFIRDSSIDEIIKILNKEMLLPHTDFPESHLEQSVKDDFINNGSKYKNGGLNKLFKGVTGNHYKTWFIYETDVIVKEIEASKEILQTLLNITAFDQEFFTSILFLLNNLSENKESVVYSVNGVEDYLLENIGNFKDSEALDVFGGGRNSIYGKCLLILIALSLKKNENKLECFVKLMNSDSYKVFWDKQNALYALGQYLFYLYSISEFQIWFEKSLTLECQYIVLISYFKYSRYISTPIFKYSKRIDLFAKILSDKDESSAILYQYMRYVFYMYLTESDNYVISLICDNISNEKIITSIASSIHPYLAQIIKLKKSTVVVKEVWVELLKSDYVDKIAGRLLFNAELVDINDDGMLTIFKRLLAYYSIDSIREQVCNKLEEFIDMGKYDDLIEILILLAKNVNNYLYSVKLDYLKDLLSKLEDRVILNDPAKKNLTQLKKILKKKGYSFNLLAPA